MSEEQSKAILNGMTRLESVYNWDLPEYGKLRENLIFIEYPSGGFTIKPLSKLQAHPEIVEQVEALIISIL